MKTEFDHNDEIIATADLEGLLCEDSTVTIFGKKYIVFENHHTVEIDENGTHEKVVCTVFTEEELDDWGESLINYGKTQGFVHKIVEILKDYLNNH